jgi:hypothetical protein
MICFKSSGALICVKRRQKQSETAMNEDAFNNSIRKFLKQVGVTSQREIEKAVRAGVASGKLKGNEKLTARMLLTMPAVGLSYEVKEEIELE